MNIEKLFNDVRLSNTKMYFKRQVLCDFDISIIALKY